MQIRKANKFLRKLHVNIEGPLPVTFLEFRYFLSIKDNAWEMFYVLLMKTKREIYDKLVDFWTWIKILIDQKIKCIYSREELRSNALNTWFKAISIQWKLLAPYILQQNRKIECGIYMLISISKLVLK